MKTKTFTLILLIVSQFIFGNNGNVISQLTTVNVQWLKQPEKNLYLNQINKFDIKNNTDWIATHLMLVETTLRNRSVSHLTKTQQQNRANCLNTLNKYWRLKKFPVNDYLSYKSPVFIDRKGTHCAVGYLMQQSGNEALALMINKEQKFAYIYDIKLKGVSEWANKNGFTIDELAWIQPAYPISSNANDLIGGLNGDVNCMILNANGVPLYVAGSFTASTSGAQCNRVALYLSGFAGWLWTGLGNGLNGTVNSMIIHNNKLYVGGEFTMADNISANHIAAYDLQTGTWQSVGSLNGDVNSLKVYNNEIYAGGNFTGLLAKWNGTQWVDVGQGMIYGVGVRTLDIFNNQLIVGGDFELATGALRKNVCAYDGSQVILFSFGMGTTNPVNDFEVYNGKLYAACDFISGSDTCALAVFDNSSWQNVVKTYNGIGYALSGLGIKQITALDNKLYCAGYFTCFTAMNYGSGLMTYEHTNGTPYTNYYLNPILNADSTIKCMGIDNSMLYFGGSFTTNSYSDTLNHIGTIDMLFNSVRREARNGVVSEIYPNPVNELLNVSNFAALKINTIKIYDLKGVEVFETAITNDALTTLNLKKLTPGIYSIQLIASDKTLNHRFVKL